MGWDTNWKWERSERRTSNAEHRTPNGPPTVRFHSFDARRSRFRSRRGDEAEGFVKLEVRRFLLPRILQNCDNSKICSEENTGMKTSFPRMALALLFSAFLVLPLAAPAATNDLRGALQTGLFEEEANRDLDAAINAYQSLVKQFDQDRKVAATAVFRLGECYRKLGKTNEAAVQYERVVREFPDQQQLVTLSRQNLVAIGRPAAQSASTQLPSAARQEQEALLKQQIKLAEQDLADVQKRTESGQATQADVRAAERDVLRLRQQLAALQANRPELLDLSVTSDDEDQEIRRIQTMIQNSPDLINSPGSESKETPLFAAASKGQVGVARFLLDHGALVDALSANRETALMAATRNGHKAMVELLLARGADVNHRRANAQTALHLAADLGFQSVAETLLANKADVNARDDNQQTPLELAAANGHGGLVSFLISKGADLNAKDVRGDTPILRAAISGHSETLTRLLKAKADPDLEDDRGRTALSYAVERGHQNSVKALLDAKANPNAGKLDLPLNLAVWQKQPEIAEMLLRANADPNLTGMNSKYVGKPNRTEFSGGRARPFGPYAPLQIAVKQDDVAMVKLLLEFKADPNTKDPWSSPPQPLTWYALGNIEMLKAFLDAGADPNAMEGSGLLTSAAGGGEADAVKALLAHKATVNPDLPQGWSGPLTAAVINNHEKCVQLLLDAGAEVNRRDGDRQNPPLLWAMEASPPNTNIVKLLLDHGADPNLPFAGSGNTALHLAVGRRRSPELIQLLLDYKADPNIRNAKGETPLDWAKGQQSQQGPPVGRPPVPPGWRAQPTYPSSSGTTSEAASTNAVVSLLREHGARDDLPDLDRIELRRTSSGFSRIIFSKGLNTCGQFTLFELVGVQYGLLTSEPGGTQRGAAELYGSFAARNPMAFPDFAHIVIRRPTPDGLGWKEDKVNIAQALNSEDCAGDVSLDWGDIVEIPEADHEIFAKWSGLSDQEMMSLKKCLTRHIEIEVKGVTNTITLSPDIERGNVAITLLKDAPYMIRPALFGSKLLQISSDLTRIKLIRRLPGQSEPCELVVDCSSALHAPDLWLRDGDVIEVPERP